MMVVSGWRTVHCAPPPHTHREFGGEAICVLCGLRPGKWTVTPDWWAIAKGQVVLVHGLEAAKGAYVDVCDSCHY